MQEIVIPRYMEMKQPKPALFARLSEDELLGYGVPPEWLDDVRRADEDTVLQLADHLPVEAAEALLDLATGTKPKPVAVPAGGSPFEHPDAQRRFRVMTNRAELERALAAKLHSLLNNEPRLAERVEVHSVYGIGRRLYEANLGPAAIVSRETLTSLLEIAAKSVDANKFSLPFLRSEWEQVVDAWQLGTWGSLSRRDATRPQNPSAGETEDNPVVGLGTSKRRARNAKADHLVWTV